MSLRPRDPNEHPALPRSISTNPLPKTSGSRPGKGYCSELHEPRCQLAVGL